MGLRNHVVSSILNPKSAQATADAADITYAVLPILCTASGKFAILRLKAPIRGVFVKYVNFLCLARNFRFFCALAHSRGAFPGVI
jgi:hypothetical protein